MAGASSPVLSTGYETNQNWEKHEGSLLSAFSDAGSTPAASTINPVIRPTHPSDLKPESYCRPLRGQCIASALSTVTDAIPLARLH